MRIERVQRKPGLVSIDFSQEGAGSKRDTFTMECHDDPSAAFDDAMKALKPHVLAMLELAETYGETLSVTQVSFGYKGKTDIMGCTMTAQKDLENARRPFVINTPYRASENAPVKVSKKGRGRPAIQPDLLTEACVEALKAVQLQAENYVKGQRSQMEFQFDNTAGVQEEKVEEEDKLLDAAKDVIRNTKRATVALLSRQLMVSKEQAKQLMDKLEEDGVVGPPTGKGGARQILVEAA